MDSNLAAYAAYETEKRRQAEQQQQNQPNLIDALGKLALGAGAVAAGAYGLRRMLPAAVKQVAQAPAESAAVRRVAGVVPADVARQQRGIELTRLARAERPQGVRQGNLKDLIESVNVQDLGPTDFPVSPERAKIDLSLINNVLIPMEQKRLPSATDFLQQRLRGQATELPASYYQRTPSTFTEFSNDPARDLLTDPGLLKHIEAKELAEDNLLPENRAEQSRQQAQLRRVRSAEADDIIAAERKKTNTTQAAAQGDFASQYLKTAGYQDDVTMVDQHTGNLVAQIDHFANASNSAEDQVTGRVKAALSRNEDVNLGAVEIAEDQVDAQIARSAQNDSTVASVTELDAAINQVADNLPDGRPIDQTEVTRSLSSQELADIAKTEMMQRRQELVERGLRPGTTRFERALAQGWTSKPGLVPGTEEFRQSISLPATVRKAVDAESAGAGPMGFIPERTVLNIGPQAKVTSTAAGTAIRGASPSLYEVLPKVEERQLYGTGDPLVFDVPEEMGPDIAGSARARGAMAADIAETEMSKQEIQYSFLNKPPAAELPGGAGGIGVYGIEPAYVPGAMSKVTGEYSTAAAERKPTYVPGWLQRKQMSSGFESLTTPQLMAAAEKTAGPRIQKAFQSEIQRRQTAKESMAVSEVLRRARIEGRDPQDFLRNFGRNI